MKDPIVEEIRKIRDAHSAKFNHNFDAVLADWMKKEATAKRAGHRFIDLGARTRRQRHHGPTTTP